MVDHPVLLLILDGWGKGAPGPGNAISLAKTPHLDALLATCPNTELQCMGESVGLPPGQMGNSEVGHLNLGAGRVVYQDIMRINLAVRDGSLRSNSVLEDLIESARARGGRIHFMGLVSDGGVHSDQAHLAALLALCKEKHFKDVLIHVFLDGRDTPPKGGLAYVRKLMADMDALGVGRIATVSGRFYAMDRDKRWDRIKLAYDAMTQGEGVAADDPLAAIQAAYDQGDNDEFVKPQVIRTPGGPVGTIQDGDAVFFFNFRADRARQLTQALFDPHFKEFTRTKIPRLCAMATMTQYDHHFGLPAAFPPVSMTNILGEVVASNGASQFRVAETEKYAHVTYFFNGGREEPFEGEERLLVPSPREVATYDQKPEMSVNAVTDVLCEAIHRRKYRLIVCNFANLDMVGHTGVIPAAVAACEAVDQCVGRVLKALDKTGGTGLITADHGNAEDMLDAGGGTKTSHSLNPVPCVLVGSEATEYSLRSGGALCDVAPTLLGLLGIKQPAEMTGRSLLHKTTG
ncbi:2,3-bisphosphoglycerate-independent phosphoglycerate mutase [Desulfoplanes formicivorans]|uniref:2,3-bisphosphoglycerate-independent phosphoglycerate mutase n=1 Tax=Desulfoplanes formicivorans TaxID=1592317 RepID=A0A194AFA5_9BACT|nr:2,3-bisphosphoglycerate-independent phosphoglycerate mutase [Desulfoplanes formicivorans]GAU07464.1 phosphoglyceromutase [Desulfoplanes formicivorans]